ncbi:tripartite tricarboxylate transporter TctB family protein [Virgibacillus sp. NKC19-16]|uniref:tripartite tricarboxylate transporter TctB family protein n=1 Tax=Virgibacillus salidurans TaxID=2831673 RepID=UPI001F1CBEB9|nr:tripartite tricarboxylate transporter TctB family protein [Virgibacillus sp. NKC19-16]UJL45563.1 tripartite tricarboxylate transporter TctB family protein [Virgibacillus sp. NKC19-16]
MRAVFSGLLLIFSIYFTIKGTEYDYTNSSGQVGPGFFPLWIGILLIICTGIAFAKDLKQVLREENFFSKPIHLYKLLLVIGLTFFFIATLNILGAVVAMVLYVFGILFVLNRQRLILNTIISVTVPLGTYLLLDVWLNAGFPQNIFGF